MMVSAGGCCVLRGYIVGVGLLGMMRLYSLRSLGRIHQRRGGSGVVMVFKISL